MKTVDITTALTGAQLLLSMVETRRAARNGNGGQASPPEELAHIEKDPRSFVESLTDREAKGPPIVLPDGSKAARLPGFRLWLWDTEFCGSIGLRWQPDTSELPPTSSDTLAMRLSHGRKATAMPS